MRGFPRDSQQVKKTIQTSWTTPSGTFIIYSLYFDSHYNNYGDEDPLEELHASELFIDQS